MTVNKYKITELLFSFWYWNKFLQIPVAKKAPTQCLPWWDPLTLASTEYKVYRFFVYKGHFEQKTLRAVLAKYLLSGKI